jgi:hypothetical protein
LAVAGVLLVAPSASQATTITVHSTADGLTGCTLRNAIKAANLNTPQGTCPAGQPSPTVDTIDFSVPSGSTITLSSALDAITGDVNITGPGQGQLTVSGADAYQPLKVNSGKTVSISGLRISHGKCDSVACNFAGGAISNHGTLTLSGVKVAQSTAEAPTNGLAAGGGVFNAGTMTIQSSTVTGNTASVSGGTIPYAQGGGVDNEGTMTIQNSTVTGNTASVSGGGGIPFADGGGVLNAGTITIQNSTVSGNTASVSGGTNAFADAGGLSNYGTMSLVLSTVTGNSATVTGGTSQNFPSGGGIFNGTHGDLTIDRSTVSSNDVTADAAGGNQSDGLGGGIENHHNLTIIRSTVSGNTVSATGGAVNDGTDGGIFNVNPASPADVTVTLRRSTLSDNTATVAGGTSQAGGMTINPGTYTIKSSTIAHNSAGSGANLVLGGTPDFRNTIVSDPEGGGTNCTASPVGMTSSYDLSSDGTCGFSGTGDHLNTDPQLAATLAANGGPTKTYALLTGSPAIDKGKASVGETVDQRGKKRPSDFGNIANAPGGDGSDIGAFEVQDTTPPTTTINSGPANGSTINDPTPTFTFHSNEAGSVFQCRTDGGPFGVTFLANCTSPKTLAHLGDGAHTFRVRAKDLAGNVGATVSRSFTVKTAEVSRSGSTLVVTAAPGAKDNFEVTRPSASTIRITDFPNGAYSGSGVHTVSGSGCARSGDYTANCNATGITLVKVSSAGSTDRITNATALAGKLLGGPANDLLVGGSGNDVLNGGTGADSFKGMNGNDTLLARDLTSDTAINCDGGTKPGSADKADLDLLPKDPNSIVFGCETKTRH